MKFRHSECRTPERNCADCSNAGMKQRTIWGCKDYYDRCLSYHKCEAHTTCQDCPAARRGA